jgi:hypothetical protein
MDVKNEALKRKRSCVYKERKSSQVHGAPFFKIQNHIMYDTSLLSSIIHIQKNTNAGIKYLVFFLF